MDGVVLASPEHYKIRYVINPLTNTNSTVDPTKAIEQFNKLKGRLESNHIPVHVIDSNIADPEGKYPDLVYVSNSALILKGWPTKVAILARYAHPERRGEEERVGAYLKHILGYKVISLPDREGLYFEGDTRWSNNGKDLWMCYGTGRTTLAGIEAVREAIMGEATLNSWPPPTIHVLKMIGRITYQLGLCFLPLPNGRVLLHCTSFSPGSNKIIVNHFGKKNCVSLPLKYLYACNSVYLDEHTLLIPKLPGCRQWMYAVTSMKIIEVNVEQFHMAGGSVACMVLPLWSLV